MPFDAYLRRWNLAPDGEPLHTNSSDLLPVRFAGEPAMLKVARIDEERVGNGLMVWWNGQGAARVLRHDEEAVLLERVEGDLSLADMVQAGQDDEASRILCGAVAVLHESRAQSWPDLPPLERWFRSLEEMAPQVGGVLSLALETAQHLFRDPRDVRPLHGDLHHGNVLHSRERGWLAIDPKGLIGERGFDYANLFCNPDLNFAATPGRLARQAFIVSESAGLDRRRLLQWIFAYAGLSAAWHLEDEEPNLADHTVEIARIAAAELGF
ncbi:aminoglycoside phosphotransferase family protein [Deinococcus planocerae]|uniref:aminoglycoside phosphotransferase family protein n=1 Tax=Deinococcus planocerae TaxID=1737569 RepID=UPI000C7EAEB7|nr:aminoglycoside phosphotransferase family protein [Deinococcus planocerae]